ncbi:MAG: TIGR03668 family PPOX class F420-dependent oxidoreductase [Streptosporangiaceae bacterium]
MARPGAAPIVRLPGDEARRRFASVRVARLATVGPDGRPHLVPFTFALSGGAGQGEGGRGGDGESGPPDRIYSAVDAKPKRSTDLRRLRNIRTNPRVAVLADHYEEDWGRLWWIRADGQAAILDDPAAMAPALELLAGRYPQYHDQPPGGPVISIRVDRWTGWAARPS